jgi:hypothetical protein
LSIPRSSLNNWVMAARKGKPEWSAISQKTARHISRRGRGEISPD